MVPSAMLRDALILKDEGQSGVAADGFRRLITAYPTSDAAFLACRELSNLGVERPAACEEIR